jgi:glycosyltransferase involved in cell wall biosynthesis
VLERPNAHTAFAYDAVAEENRNVGIQLSHKHDHTFNQQYLDHEEMEYDEADFLLCPSDFVAETFVERGFPRQKLIRHQYGFDSTRFSVGPQNATQDRGLVMIYAGVVEPRKGLHLALRAWLDSGAHRTGKFLICGAWVQGYRERLGRLLQDPSIEILGHRPDIDLLMRGADLFVLPSVEEGSALVTYEARASGCILLVSTASGAPCEHGVNGLTHAPRDVETLTQQITGLNRDRNSLRDLRAASVSTLDLISWEMAGIRLSEAYGEASRELPTAADGNTGTIVTIAPNRPEGALSLQ